jgi:hypothetical protein
MSPPPVIYVDAANMFAVVCHGHALLGCANCRSTAALVCALQGLLPLHVMHSTASSRSYLEV